MRRAYIIIAMMLYDFVAMGQFTNCAIYFSAHPDDWQLFIGTNAYNDIQETNTKVVFIYVTAGDAGLLAGKVPPATVPYYVARERGAKYSQELAVNAKFNTSTPAKPKYTYKFFNGHNIVRYELRNTRAYFLRLPDGLFNGSATASLKNLYIDSISTLSAVDSFVTFDSWLDLVSTIKALVDTELVGISNAWINYPDPDPSYNWNDHSDHQHTGLLVQQAIVHRQDINQRLYMNYKSGIEYPNLGDEAIKNESALFAAYCVSLHVLFYNTDWRQTFTKYCNRNYFHEIPATGSMAKNTERHPNASLSVMPNPTGGVLNLVYENKQAGWIQVGIFDLQGNIILVPVDEYKEKGTYEVQLNTAGFTKGTYIIRQTDMNGYTSEEKLLIQ